MPDPGSHGEAAGPKLRGSGEESHRILLIDDSALVARLTAMNLEEQGHQVAVVHDGPSGLAAARQTTPDVVLCDISLQGDMDGYEVARTLRADPSTCAAVLIAVTGYDDGEHMRLAQEAGFDALLPKPLDFQHLAQVLAQRP